MKEYFYVLLIETHHANEKKKIREHCYCCNIKSANNAARKNNKPKA